MAKYLTPSMFYLADDSVPGATGIDVQVLDRTIRRAESLIDTYIGFDARWGGFEPHTATYQANFDEYTLRVQIPNFPTPVRSVIRYRIQVSNTGGGDGFFANINSQDTVINNVGGYIEIVPLQSITYSMTPFMWGLGLQPPIVQLDYSAGFYFPVFGDTLRNASQDGQTYRALRGFWSSTYTLATNLIPAGTAPAAPPNVYVNGVLQLASAYTIDYTEGVVTFTTPNAAGSVVTADYVYTIPDAVTDAAVSQVTWMLNQRNLNLMGLGGIEVARSRDQQIKRHIRTSAGASNKDEPAISSEAMQLLEPYTYIPVA